MYSQTQDRRTPPTELLLSYMSPMDARQYRLFQNVRVEVLKLGDELVAYEMDGRSPKIHAILEVDHLDFGAGDGIHVYFANNLTGEDECDTVSFLPTKPFGINAFLFLPLNPGFRYDPTPEDLNKGTLQFPVVIRTKSRMNMREPGVVHVEKRKDFEATFGNII